MSVEIRVPKLGKSVSEATVAKWLKKVGDAVAVDEPLVELETDKVNLEVPSPVAGVLSEITVPEGTDVAVNSILGSITDGVAGAAATGGTADKPVPTVVAKPSETSAPQGAAEAIAKPATPVTELATSSGAGAEKAGPAARKLAAEAGLDLAAIAATGPKGNVTKGDVQAAAATPKPDASPTSTLSATTPPAAPTDR